MSFEIEESSDSIRRSHVLLVSIRDVIDMAQADTMNPSI